MAIESPFDHKDTTKKTALFYCDLIVSIIFAFEVILKVISMGFVINGKQSYLRSMWNILDFIIVFVSIVSLISHDN